MVLAAWCVPPYARREDSVRRIHLGVGVTFLRAAFAALVILAITTVAGVVGPRWAGLFLGFSDHDAAIFGHYPVYLSNRLTSGRL
jgi:hypothetical protein